MQKKLRVAILFGGRSAEHEVSLQSAKNVLAAINKKKYEVIEIFIPKNGDVNQLVEKVEKVDVIFPVLHGSFGEDGTMQGLLKLANVPFVGAGVLASAVGMDKDIMKRLLREARIPVANFLVLHGAEIPHTKEQEFHSLFGKIVKKLGLPFFIKPANAGSSVGVSKVHALAEFAPALKEAFLYDHKIILERYIQGREVECSVLGNDMPLASIPGEIIPQHEFYDYDAKYIDQHGALFHIPANLPAEVVQHIQELAVKTFRVLCCAGMARVDFFLSDEGKLYVNEINTIPGFTQISMYPKLWEASGISYPELIDRLIQLAQERFEQEKQLKTSH